MTVFDQLSADVMTTVDGPGFGRAASYFAAGSSNAQSINFIVDSDNWKSVFDTGGSEIDFNVMSGKVSVNEISAPPQEQGRGTAGDTIVFNDVSTVTWHVRATNADARYAGCYYQMTITDYNGPMTGV